MVVTHPATGDQLNIGLDVVAVPQLRPTLEYAEASGCDFVLAPLVHPRYERSHIHKSSIPNHDLHSLSNSSPDLEKNEESLSSPPDIVRDDPLTRSDLELSSGEWQAGVVGKLSPWIRPDAPSPALRKASEEAFAEEVAFASHVAIRALVVPTPRGGRDNVANLARCIRAALSKAPGLQIWLRMPMKDVPSKIPPLVENGEGDGGDAEMKLDNLLEEKDLDPWEIWNSVRLMCGSHPNLCVALEMTPALPSKIELDRWAAEPVKIIFVSTSLYVTNRVGFPVLSRKHQDFIRHMFQYRPFFAITGRAQKVKGGDGYRPFVQYLAHLFGKMPASTEAESFEAPYYDYLQAPLQPLANNLESQTYETFEKDAIKYERYEEAVKRCLKQGKYDRKVVIVVVGAGRGPLVRASLNAAAAAEIKAEVYAVEKNPNAIITLRNLKLTQKWTNVSIISSDMRNLPNSLTGIADIIVSELLGSFGDNELSPECLTGAQKVLKKTGVSIPSSYTSFLAPMASTKLHNEVKGYGDSISTMETAYVVRIHRAMLLAEPKAVFTFEHPAHGADGSTTDVTVDNSRYAKLSFTMDESNICHGFAGYFETTLFDDVTLSIKPDTHSEGMFSWFPVYFPMAQPIVCEKGKTLTVHMWRRCAPTTVHYEWCISSPIVSPIHNPEGRSYSIGL
eukprot:Plantae.Rhodophyta-Hildenbrandia_rubra.ctg5823.p1 GENE.Plantae.Rhodophyta-Hildenbrandia_rubra.ctg5823~~Plantae.Rhodophyta-Hildenbrandia_rubra.ctg5823.p1  ORF type:complete len:676 (+),score=92.43 Plantae.Rhodophyta-Hildenbrandia_rubra.ctg5823:201-2228(+)